MQPSSNQDGDGTRREALFEATRRLLRVDGPEAVRDAAIQFVVGVGATISTTSDEPALPFDISFGVGEPVFPSAPVGTLAREFLEAHLPRYLMDGARAIELAAHHAAPDDAASIDPLTGLPDRSMIDRTLHRLRSDDTIVMIDLEQMAEDHPDSGEEILRVFGRVLRATSRGRDVVGRYNEEEFVAVLSGGGNATAFLRRLLEEWKRNRPQPISFSAGIVHPTGDRSSTLALVDQAVTLAKEGGRGRWVWIPGGAVPEELGPGPLSDV